MKKLFVIIAMVAATLGMSCRATVTTPKTNTDVQVGSIQPAYPADASERCEKEN